MTLSPSARAANFREALKRMLERVGDEAVGEVFFSPQDLVGILPTTLDELRAFGFIEQIPPTGMFSLTGRGWTAALLDTGANSEDAFEERIGRLFSKMKGFVKGRHEPYVVPLRALAAESGLPEGWVFNIIEGKYMEEVRGHRGASWFKHGRVVLIPASFDVEPVDLQTLLNADLLRKVEGLEEDLDLTRDALSQYLCPYCGAGLGSFGVFACGYPEKPCPSDPEFPKLEDFELKLRQDSYGEWICEAKGKTPNARRVGLGSQPGRTEDEARQRVIDRYNWVSRKRF